MDIKANFKHIQQEIVEHAEEAGRSPNEIHIIAVTKYVSVQKTQEAVQAGIVHIGENRKEGLLQKKNELKDKNINWHFIGSLQTRKVKDIINDIDYLHSLDRVSLAKEIQNRLTKPVLKCFIQVNLSGEASKHGMKAEELLPFIESVRSFDKVQIVGLMTMAPHIADKEAIRAIFKELKKWQTTVQQKGYNHAPCEYLSMGMSNDYTIAVEEGAHFVRIGTALVGKDE